jgi:hypothetical protein
MTIIPYVKMVNMIGTLLRWGWRLVVGIVAIGLAWATFFLMYPYLDDHLPLLIVLGILYIWIAYVGIPFLVRLWHIVLRPNHLPQYVTSGDGWSSDPVNIVVVCRSRGELIQAMTKAGWHMADRGSIRTNMRLAWAVLFNRPYPTAPFSRLYLFGRQQDIGFQIPTNGSPRHRHHVRFWQLQPDQHKKPHHHHTFWHSIFKLFTHKEKQIWIGAATHDIGPFALRIQTLQITHKIDAQTDRERDFVLQTLENSASIRRQETIKSGEPLTFRGQTFGINIVTDGTLRVVELKHQIGR